jgi:ribosome-binding factor A
MSELRKARIRSAIERELAKYLHSLDDERLHNITITNVVLSRDLRYAKVYFTSLGHEEEKDEILEALTKASRRIQKDVANRLKNMRYVPLLSFHFDLSIQKGNKMLSLLDKVQEEINRHPEETSEGEQPTEEQSNKESAEQKKEIENKGEKEDDEEK